MFRAATTILIAVFSLTGRAAPPPVSAFASLPDVATISLSPDGQRLLILKAIGETHHPVVTDIETGKSNIVMAADPEEFLFNWCRWANDNRIVCSIRRYDTLQAGQIDARGYRYYKDNRITFTRMLAVDADGRNVLQLIDAPINRSTGNLKWNAVDQDDVLSWLPDDPDHVIVQLAREERTRPSIYRLNINTNRLSRIRRYHDSVYAWHVDRSGLPRFASGFRNDTPVAFGVDGSRLQEIDLPKLGERDELLRPAVIGLSGDGSKLYYSSYRNGERRAFYRADSATGDNVEVLFADPQFDVFGSILAHPVTGDPLLLQYLRDDITRHWFDQSLGDALAEAFATLAQVHSRTALISLDNRMNRFVFAAEGAGTPPTYYLYDRAEKSLMRIARTYPELDEIAESTTVRYPARDGYPIPAVLTLPTGTGPHPTILLPHGGPNSRDSARFDYWTAFFASRGYAVLQPNFRGSTGYGVAHLKAGFEQWGLRMQDDVLDGLDWLIRENITDPARVCFVGASYGGYTALVAAFKTPQRLRCAVSFAGVTDLAGLKERVRAFELGELDIARIQEGTAMNENSPLRQVARMGVPLLIVHGDVDRTVMIEQSRDLVDALDSAGKAHIYIEQRNGDHFLSLASHRLELFEAMEAFLKEHLR